jgi:group I intron endonuclease
MNIEKGFGYKKSGIYCIKNITNSKCYIGSSTHIYYRVRRHKSDLIRQVHANPILQNAYNKYGATSFEVSIIEECSDNIILQREQHYIDKLSPAYNITKEVINNRLSAESRLKISETLKEKVRQGLILYPLNVDKQKEVIVYDANCKCIQSFLSQRAAGRYLQTIYPEFSPKTVSMIVNKVGKNKRGRYKNHFILYPGDKCIKDIIRSDAFKILCLDIKNNTANEYKRSIDLAVALNCTLTSVLRALKKDRLLLKRYKLTKL